MPAPTTVIERPHIITLLNSSLRSVAGGADAMHNAPIVESGDESTRWPPTMIDRAILSGSAPPSCSTSLGTIGRKAGRTTPDVLLYTDTPPVSAAMIGVIVRGVAMRLMISAKRSMPPV